MLVSIVAWPTSWSAMNSIKKRSSAVRPAFSKSSTENLARPSWKRSSSMYSWYVASAFITHYHQHIFFICRSAIRIQRQGIPETQNQNHSLHYRLAPRHPSQHHPQEYTAPVQPHATLHHSGNQWPPVRPKILGPKTRSRHRLSWACHCRGCARGRLGERRLGGRTRIHWR